MKVLSFDFVVVGGGMSGLCAAIAAARHGAKTALIHARPMLGGNAGSEIRMHICGADYHMTRPNARETGIIEEILLEHKKSNPTNSYAIFDSILWGKAAFCKNLTLFLNTCVDGANVENGRVIGVTAYQQTTEKRMSFTAPLFADATGDGSIGAWSGADYTVGREGKDTYGEPHAPNIADNYTMGSSLMFKARDTGRPVPFIKPEWANTYTEYDLRRRIHDDITSGYWWIELGGKTYNTISDAEILRDELLKIVYGVWDHIKNGGDHGAQNMELEWVGMLPGKRESRRLLGDYVLCENDCVEGKRFEDAVAYGGWPMDIHTVGGFLNDGDDPTVWIKLKDVYTIPYRCFYSRNISNLFICGRIISASHMAFASARVMATCAVGGQAVGTAAAIAIKKKILPRDVGKHIIELQQTLLKDDCYIPGVINEDPDDLLRMAQATASSAIEGCGAENVLNGIARTVGINMNCWAAKEEDEPVLTIKMNKAASVSKVHLTFDSNLSREITISINQEVIERQSVGTPPELVKKCRLIFKRNGQCVYKQELDENYQRHCIIDLGKPIICDTIKLEDIQTYGSSIIRVFEMRAYA
ncbi:MAG: FAD-dependent oxidoreductase [Christensenellales bacterium]|jgi:hypothetical protein